MAEIKVTISPELLALPARLERALTEGHEAAARAVVSEVRFQTIQSGSVATKGFLNSIDKQFEMRGAVRAWLIGSALPYAPFVEYGRKPGKQPPVDAILRWIVFKGIGGPHPRRQAFAIARTIGKRGVKGRYPFRRAVESSLPRVNEAMSAALGKVQSEIGR